VDVFGSSRLCSRGWFEENRGRRSCNSILHCYLRTHEGDGYPHPGRHAGKKTGLEIQAVLGSWFSIANDCNKGASVVSCARPLTRNVVPLPGMRKSKATRGSPMMFRSESRYARRHRQSGSDRLEKQPTDLRRNPRDLGDGTLATPFEYEHVAPQGRDRNLGTGHLRKEWYLGTGRPSECFDGPISDFRIFHPNKGLIPIAAAASAGSRLKLSPCPKGVTPGFDAPHKVSRQFDLRRSAIKYPFPRIGQIGETCPFTHV
jgi:hypothetical protein